MGEKDENIRQVFITSDGIARRMTIVDDLIHDLSEKLVDDAGVGIGSGENVNEFKVSLSFNVDSLKIHLLGNCYSVQITGVNYMDLICGGRNV